MRAASVRNGPGKLGTKATVGPHTWVMDEPPGEGGDDAGPTPREALLGALGACTATTVRLYAARKGWRVSAVDVDLSMVAEPGKKARIEKRVVIRGELDAEQLRRLYEIAAKCPIHRMLTEGADIVALEP